MRTYLSSDGMQIYTDFELTPTSFVAGSPRTQAAPGPRPPIIVKQLGGTLSIAGTEVTVVDSHLALLPVGKPLILFLEEIENGTKYQLVGIHWGAFEVDATDRIVPLINPPELQADYASRPVDDFMRDVNKFRAARP